MSNLGRTNCYKKFKSIKNKAIDKIRKEIQKPTLGLGSHVKGRVGGVVELALESSVTIAQASQNIHHLSNSACLSELVWPLGAAEDDAVCVAEMMPAHPRWFGGLVVRTSPLPSPPAPTHRPRHRLFFLT